VIDYPKNGDLADMGRSVASPEGLRRKLRPYNTDAARADTAMAARLSGNQK
jgi:hypothetical protein